MSENVEIKIDWFRSLKWTIFRICILIIIFSILDCMNNFDFANNMHKENENESQDSVDRRKLTHKIYTIAITVHWLSSPYHYSIVWSVASNLWLCFDICYLYDYCDCDRNISILLNIRLESNLWKYNQNNHNNNCLHYLEYD